MEFITAQIEFRDVYEKTVLEVGAYDENGSAKPHVTSLFPASYLGTDMRSGPRVDLIIRAEDLPSLGQQFDLVITTEMLEHAEDWRACMEGMIRVVKPGGILFITTRSPGFPYHAFPDDHWRYSVKQMGDILTGAGLTVMILKPDPSPHEPGVHAKARKPIDWTWPENTGWENIILEKPSVPADYHSDSQPS